MNWYGHNYSHTHGLFSVHIVTLYFALRCVCSVVRNDRHTVYPHVALPGSQNDVIQNLYQLGLNYMDGWSIKCMLLTDQIYFALCNVQHIARHWVVLWTGLCTCTYWRLHLYCITVRVLLAWLVIYSTCMPLILAARRLHHPSPSMSTAMTAQTLLLQRLTI